jgi:hypothetical protein
MEQHAGLFAESMQPGRNGLILGRRAMQMSARIFASAILTAAGLALSPAAEANDRFWSGIAPSFNRPAEPSARSERSPERSLGRSYERERRPTTLRRHAAPVQKTPSVSYADGEGREYDPVSRVWFDGDGECWLGTQAFSVRHGTWFYGDRRWQQVDGLWLTKAAPSPTRVDCKSIAKFAAKLKPAPEQTATPNRVSQDGDGLEHPGLVGQQTEVPPLTQPPVEGAALVRIAPDGTPQAPSACRAYLPGTGDGQRPPCDR